jgi:O-acetylhomoserine (thiol)-lyase
MKPETIAIHGGVSGDPATGASSVAIYQSAAFAYGTAGELSDVFAGRAPGHIYSRISNPTTYALERRLTELEGGVGCVATASGMGAISAVATALLKAGDEIIAAKGIFGGTVSLFEKTLGRFGITTHFVDATDTSQFSGAINDRTKLIFVETIGNPRMDVPDISAIAQVARTANIPFVVDSTVTTPMLVRGGDLGADIVIHSTSKFINGHGTAIGGAIIDTGKYDWSKSPCEDISSLAKRAGQFAFLAYLRNVVYRDLGCCPAPMNSFLMLQGLETLAVRMNQHCENALKLAAWLNDNEKVVAVNFPGLKDSEHNKMAAGQFGGRFGAVLTFKLSSKAAAFKFIDSLKIAKNLANLGDAKTLVIHPASTIFHEFGEGEKVEMGVTDDMIRVSVGTENFKDIKNDFEQASSE